ncbi:MAG TPA: hypothetical protein DC054_03235 [Blastocatellia bacterium]|nr:hypothetical protein [Blastocatellia bacterium]
MSSRSISLFDKKSFASTFTPETGHVGVVALVSIAVVLPMVFWGVPSANDLSNHFRFALPFYDALQNGHLYPGWLAETNHGLGDPSFRFYPPALYYMLAAARALSGNWYAATVATFGTLSMMGALGMYLWAREFTSSQNAMWAGIFYAVAPYHLNQLFQALMLAEFAGAALLPFAFLFVERVCRHRRRRDIAGLAVSFALLLLTHLPLAIIGSIALSFYALLRTDRKKVVSTMSALATSVGVGLAASACYWVTMLFELRWIHGNDINPEPGIDYRANFVLSTFSSDFINVWWMNILLLVTIMMFWPALILATRAARRNESDSNRSVIVASAMLLSLTLFMATPLSRPLWNLVRPLQETQFPWRWFSITSMVASLLLAQSLPFWTRLAKTTKRPIVMLAVGTMVISFAFSISHIIREARWLTPAQFEQRLSDLRGSQSIHFWLPVWAHEPLPKTSAPVDAGDRVIEINSWMPEKRSFRASSGNASEARIQTFFYPHWRATASGQNLTTRANDQGLLLVELPPQAATVQLEFHEPTRTRVARAINIAGIVLIGLLVAPISLKKRIR